jgi:hypothetical protein
MLDMKWQQKSEGICRDFTGRNEEWKDVAKEEFVAFAGSLTLCGVSKKRKEPVYQLWAAKFSPQASISNHSVTQ